MELILIFLGMILILVLNAYQIQILKNEIEEIKKEEKQKPKQFKREHSNVSKTNFRKYIKWSNRCICQVQK